ncbi:MAG: UDP-glucose 4-epimerase GalE [Fimbriimonadaceae bacterium]|nr:UDP-glucose 4-epimerase GalE [Fimbriimonadaceae bacterium]
MILVTGGAGYIGSHMCRLLRQRGLPHLACDNLSKGHAESLPGTPLVCADLHDTDLLTDVMRAHNIRAVVHFAASIEVGESVADPLAYAQNNIAGTISLLQAMRRADVRDLVFSSTAAVYGNPDRTPIPEDHPKRPTSPYGFTKHAVETLIESSEGAYGLRAIRLRYFNASGASPEGDIGEAHDPETHLIPVVLQVALGQRDSMAIFGSDYPTPDGTCVRDYVHVADLADAHLLALDALERGVTGAFNLGTGTGYSVREVIETCRKVTGHAIPTREAARRPGDPATLVASSARAREILGWVPERSSLQRLVADAWRWHQTHPLGYVAEEPVEAPGPPMRRSEINALKRLASDCFARHGWTLPPDPKWDVTDFGLGDWRTCGLVLVNLAEEAEYCEKLMYARRGMVTPAHHHRRKKEDIVCRWGRLAMRCQGAGGGSAVLRRNGIETTVHPQATLVLEAGERVTLVPGVVHAFWPESDECIIGEVSTQNDDLNDNVFQDPRIGRFPGIVEDET